MVFSNNLLMGAGGQASGYEIEQSCIFNRDDDATLTRTFGTPTNRRKYSLSVWQKNGRTAGSMLEHNTTGGVTWANITFGQGGRVDFFDYSSGSARIDLRTTAVYRDPSAWYHLFVVVDTTQSTASNRVKIYVNGVQETSFGTSTYPSQNFDGLLNSAVAHLIGDGVNGPLDGYLAEYHFFDGQTLAPTDFGETNSNGVWVPIKYTGGASYGDNGYYLTFADSSALGDDTSGEGHDWTANNLASADQVTDSPTKNFTTFNPVGSCAVSGQTLTLSNGNLRSSAGGTANAIEAVGTIAPTTGKYYAEFTLNASPQLSNQYPAIGIIGIDLNITGGNNLGDSSFFGYLPNGEKKKGGTTSSYGNTFTNGDVIGIAMDLDNQKIWFSKNGTYQDSGDPAAGSDAAFTDLVAGTQYRFCVSHAGSSATDVTMNAGQSAFSTAAPTGFKALNAVNLATPTIKDGSKHFQTTLYNGTGSELEVDQSGENSTFQPDFAWIKNRTNAGNEHDLYDAVRGATKAIFSSSTNAESTQAQGLKSFDGDGFTVGTRGEVNTSGSTNVAWQWLANNTTGSTNDDGSVDSTVAVNTTAGFSICKFNPGGNSNVTFGHGLGVAPRLVLVKNLEDATNWQMLHLDQGVGNKLFLNTNGLPASDANMWQNTAPTSTVVSVGTSQTTNEQNIAYVFAEVEGFSKIRSYVANASTDGPFVYCGFRPAFVMFISIAGSGAGRWMLDTARNPFNVADDILQANSNAAESSGSSYNLDFLSNGFKVRTASDFNASGRTIAFVAFAEHPFGGDGIAPVTAR